MPLWIVILTLLSLLSLLSYGRLTSAFLIFSVLILSGMHVREWHSYPSAGEPYTIPSLVVQLAAISFILLFEFTPLKVVIRRSLKLVVGLFLLGISLYWVGKPYIVTLDIYAYTPVTLALIVGTPLLSAVALSKEKQGEEK